jgi:hypothetical protein
MTLLVLSNYPGLAMQLASENAQKAELHKQEIERSNVPGSQTRQDVAKVALPVCEGHVAPFQVAPPCGPPPPPSPPPSLAKGGPPKGAAAKVGPPKGAATKGAAARPVAKPEASMRPLPMPPLLRASAVGRYATHRAAPRRAPDRVSSGCASLHPWLAPRLVCAMDRGHVHALVP